VEYFVNRDICIYIYLFMKTAIPLPCMCAMVRRAARVMTQIYDDAMRPEGLRATQFSILQALSLAGPRRQGELGEILAMDSTTLTRSMELLRRRGWTETAPGKDRRERWLRLSKAGEEELVRLEPVWRKAQADVQQRLGSERWDGLMGLSTDVANLNYNMAQGSGENERTAEGPEEKELR
jgi:DNA-binding MarR family transcriptional regulator